MFLTEKEVFAWIDRKDVELVSSSRQYDECGNSWGTWLYKLDGDYYSIKFDNESPSRAWDNSGLMEDEQGNQLHEIKKVFRKTRTVEQVCYCDEKGHIEYTEKIEG